MNDNDQIITTKEARKLLEGEARKMSDAQVEELVNQLDFIATMAINKYQSEQSEGKETNGNIINEAN